MPDTTFHLAGRPVRQMGFGAMQLPGPGVFGPPKDRATAVAILRRVVEAGVNHIDTAQFYGPDVANELIREALYPYPEDLVLVSKVGAARDASGAWVGAQRPEELRAGVEANLTSLGLEQVPVVNLRRHPGVDVPFEDQVAEMVALRQEGLIGAIGLSTVTLDEYRQGTALTAVACVQNAYSVADRSDQGVFDACRDDDVAYVPYFPLGSAFMPDKPVLRHPGRTGDGRAARFYGGAGGPGLAAPTGAERAAHPGHVLPRAPRGEPGGVRGGPRRRGVGVVGLSPSRTVAVGVRWRRTFSRPGASLVATAVARVRPRRFDHVRRRGNA